MKLNNAKQTPSVWYGLHFAPGVAQYKEMDGEPIILINEQTAKAMDKTFPGKPVFVHHVEEVDLKNLQAEADGYVVESFFNKSDGNHWCKFIAVSDSAHEAIQKGWVLSNAYSILESGPAGQWQGLEYQKEVRKGEYDHLALVPNPRYQQSIILDPEGFKAYNSKKETELLKLANSKGVPMLNIFKKTKVDNDISDMIVTLPKSKKDISITKLVNDMDTFEMNADKPYMCNGEERVKVGEKEMSVNELLESYNSMMAKNAPEDADDEAKKKALEIEVPENAEEDEKAKNEAEEAKKKEDESKKEKAMNAKLNADKLLNAEKAVADKLKNSKVIETSHDQLARGQKRYGSTKK